MILKRNLKIKKPIWQLSDEELRSEIHAFLIKEHHARPRKLRAKWHLTNNRFLTIYRKNRIALALEYKKRNIAISNMLFKQCLPSWRNWPGTLSFFNTNIYKETKEGYIYSHTEAPHDK